MAKYSEKAQDKVHDVMHEFKEGKLKSSAGNKVKSRKQAIAIGLSEAREKGYKAPPKKGAKKAVRKTARKSAAKRGAKKTAAKKTASKKKASKK